MMSYPKQLFRHPGPYGKGKRSYMVIGASSAEEEVALVGKGWFASKEELFGESPAKQTQGNDNQPDDISPPTREELEVKAAELGIGFNVRTKDEVLAARIAEALT